MPVICQIPFQELGLSIEQDTYQIPKLFLILKCLVLLVLWKQGRKKSAEMPPVYNRPLLGDLAIYLFLHVCFFFFFRWLFHYNTTMDVSKGNYKCHLSKDGPEALDESCLTDLQKGGAHLYLSTEGVQSPDLLARLIFSTFVNLICLPDW